MVLSMETAWYLGRFLHPLFDFNITRAGITGPLVGVGVGVLDI